MILYSIDEPWKYSAQRDQPVPKPHVYYFTHIEVLNKEIYRDRKKISGFLCMNIRSRLKNWKAKAKIYRIYFDWGEAVMRAHICGYTKNHQIVYVQWVNYIELYLHKTVTFF